MEDYQVAVQIGGGDDYITMKHMPLMLEGLAREWLNQLPSSNIHSSDDLARLFVMTFEGTYKHLCGLTELQHCFQKSKKTFR